MGTGEDEDAAERNPGYRDLSIRGVAAAAVFAAVVVMSGCAASSRPEAAVSRTVGSATPISAVSQVHRGPREVVEAFLSAVVDERGGDAAALLGPEGAVQVGGTWINEGAPLRDIRVGAPRQDVYAQQNRPSYSQVMFVPVTFYLDDFSGYDGFSGGYTQWGYQVGETADGSWLILDNGPF